MTERRIRYLLFLILAGQLVLGASNAFVQPLWNIGTASSRGIHEEDNLHILRFISAEGRLPTVDDMPEGTAGWSQVTQPPLYFLTAAPVAALFDDGGALNAGFNPQPLCIGGETAASLLRLTIPTPNEQFPPQGAAAATYGVRLLNLALGAAAVVFTFAAGRVLFPKRPALALAAAALLAFEPSVLQTLAVIANDSLLLTIAAVNLYCAARLIRSEPVRWGWAGALFVLSALAVLTRLSGWAVLGLNALVLLTLAGRLVWRGLQQRAGRRQAWIALGMVGALAAGVIAIAALNFSTSGSVFGRYSFLDERIGRAFSRFDLSPLVLTTVLERTRLAFLEPLELLSPRRAVSVIYVLAPLIALGGALAALVVALVRRLRRLPAPALAALLLLWAAFITAAGLVYFRNVIDAAAYGGVTEYNSAGIFTPIRYYAPGLPPLTLLIAAGALALMQGATWLIGRWAPSAGEWMRRIDWAPAAGLALLWGTVALLGTIAVARAVPAVPAYTLEQARGLPGFTAVADTGGTPGVPRIVGYQPGPDAGAGMTGLTLYVTLDELGVSALGRVLMTANGAPVSACEIVPGRGTLPLSLWEPGVVYGLEVSLPDCREESSGMLDLAVQWETAHADGALTGDSSLPVMIGSVPALGQRAPSCPAALGQIAGYRIVKYTGPETVQAGEVLLPSLNWIVESVSAEADSRVYTFTHEASGQAFTCARMDGEFTQWTRATYRYFDRCVFTFPPDAPYGSYIVSVAILDANGAPLPATGPDGASLPDGQVVLGHVTLE